MFGVNGPLGFWVQRVTYLVDQNRTIRGPREGALLDRASTKRSSSRRSSCAE